MFFNSDGSGKRIGIFGGSFDPPHVGHTEICKWLFNKGLIDKLFVIPCFIHPFDKEMGPFEDRLAMAKLAFGKLMLPIECLDMERELGGVSHTLRTIEEIKRRNPDAKLSLVLGQDTIDQSSEWHDFDGIRSIVDIIAIPRGKNSPIPDVSSTAVRNHLKRSGSIAGLVEREVAIYIVTKGLYR